MNHEGPLLESLLRRVVETPGDFLREPKHKGGGIVHVAAVAGDLIGLLGGEAQPADLQRFAGSDAESRKHHAVALLLCWLYADDWFQRQGLTPAAVVQALDRVSMELSRYASATKLQTDPDRREELVRAALAQLGYRPEGESLAQAQDRLTALSAAEHRRVVQAASDAEKRARAVRAALAKKAAEESADKWTRE
jgi:hypothetical protein